MEFNSELLGLMRKVTGAEPVAKTTTINIVPGIDWSKEDVVMTTSSGVLHTFKSEKDLSKHYIEVDQAYGHKAVALEVLDDYISVKKYEAPRNDTFATVTKAQNWFDKEGKINLYHGSIFNQFAHKELTEWETLCEFDDMEVRIYKDCKIAFVYMVELAGEKIYYTLNKDSALIPNAVSFDREKPITDPINAKWFDAEVRKSAEEPYAIRIYDDKDAKDNAYKFGAKMIQSNILCSYALESGWPVEESNRKIGHGRYWERDVRAFSKEKLEKVYAFFEIDSEELAYAKTKYKEKYGCSDVKTIEDVFNWVGLIKKETSSPEATKADIGKMLREYVNPEWKDMDTVDPNGIAVWARNGAWIVLGYAGGVNRSTWGYGKNSKKIFAYNTETKVRFYGETKDDGEHWEFPIPGCDYIENALGLGTLRGSSYDSFGTDPRIRKQIIKGGISIRELFDKSNVAWILDNPDAMECEVRVGGEDRWSKTIIKVKEQLTEKYIGNVALCILTTTGNPALEMMLKSKLFNMYFYGIECLTTKEFGTSFIDLDKKLKRASGSKRTDWELKGADFVFHSKEKNLKKMFGWNYNILREVDKECGFEEPDKEDWSTDEKRRHIPKMYGVEQSIGADIVTLDPVSITKLVSIAKNNGSSKYYWRRGSANIWMELKDLMVKNTPRCTPKIRIQYIEACKNCVDIYTDYLKARGDLVDFVEKHPGEVYCDEKSYPILPKPAQKFIPYFSKLGFLDKYWGSCEGSRDVSERDFKNDLMCKYDEAYKDGRMVFEENPYSGITGCYIKMTPEEHIQFLHDEVSQMARFFTSDVDQKDFELAMKRVEPTQWRDAETGLEIVAPKFVKDIIQEGSELDHCVGTYVNAILGGRENIVFLRRTDMPDRPFFTVELLDDGMDKGRFDIGEVHCFRNGNTEIADQEKAFKDSGLEVYNKTFNIMKFLKRWCAAKSHLLNRRNIDSGDIKRVAREAIGGTKR